MALHHHIKKLQELPEHQKKLIFFAVMFVAVVAVIFWGVASTKSNMAKLKSSSAPGVSQTVPQ